MTNRQRRFRIRRHGATGFGWELATAQPHGSLRYDVYRYQGYIERGGEPIRRRELPGARVVLIINFGPPVLVADPRMPTSWSEQRGSFVAGLDDGPSLVETQGMEGMQVDFTPIGAHRFFGLPMRLLTGRLVNLEDVLGHGVRIWIDRLESAPDWRTRFAILDSFIAARLARSDEDDGSTRWAWLRLCETGGQAGIGDLADELGWSRQRLIRSFQERVGLPPKRIARLLRFQKAVRLLQGEPVPRWPDVIHRCGYYDQSHLIREFRQFAGCTPEQLVDRRLPGSGGFAG